MFMTNSENIERVEISTRLGRQYSTTVSNGPEQLYHCEPKNNTATSQPYYRETEVYSSERAAVTASTKLAGRL